MMHFTWPPHGLLLFKLICYLASSLVEKSLLLVLLASALFPSAARKLITELFGSQSERQMEGLSTCMCQYLGCEDCANNTVAHKHPGVVSQNGVY